MPTEPHPQLNDLIRAAEDAYSGLRLAIESPTEDELASGTRRFSYSEDGWTVSGHARLDGGVVQLLSLDIRPALPGGSVSASLVKGVPVGRIVGSLQTLLTLDRARREGVQPAEAKTAAVGQGRRGGKPPVTDDLLRSLAEEYLIETADGRPPRPLARIAEKFGRPEETVRTWLARARREGWLAPGVRGRAGAEPGPKLLLARMSDLLELGPFPADEPLEAKIDRAARRNRLQNQWFSEREQQPEADGQ